MLAGIGRKSISVCLFWCLWTSTSMRILIVNPPHPATGSRIPKEQLPALGLLSVDVSSMTKNLFKEGLGSKLILSKHDERP